MRVTWEVDGQTACDNSTAARSEPGVLSSPLATDEGNYPFLAPVLAFDALALAVAV
jgi:hypothetical protein